MDLIALRLLLISSFLIVTMANQKFVIVGAGPVGSLAALYAASRGIEVELYELRGGQSASLRLAINMN